MTTVKLQPLMNLISTFLPMDTFTSYEKIGYPKCHLPEIFPRSEIKEKNLNQKKMTKIISIFLFLTEKLYICRLKIEQKEINY